MHTRLAPAGWRRIALLVVVALAAATAALTLPATPAGAIPAPSIAGTVTDALGAPLQGVWVSASSDGGGGDTTTGPDGTYLIDDIEPGDYAVQFVPEGNLVTEYYDGALDYWSHTPVTVEAEGTTTGIDAQLEVGGTITGALTDAEGDPIDVEVIVYGESTGFSKHTNGSGTYTMEGLPDDEYRVEFRAIADPYLIDQYYDGAFDYWDATLVGVTAGATVTDIDASLHPGGTLSGTVTDAGGTPYEEAYVTATNAAFPEVAVSAFTASDGTYTVEGLPVGLYTVYFQPPNGTPFVVAEYFAGAPYIDDAVFVAVNGGVDTPGIDASLGAGGTISGTVTDSDTNPVEGATVTAFGPAGAWTATTASDGTYTVPALVPGDYDVAFAGPDGSGLVPQFWEGVTDPGAATPVTVTAGADTPGIDAALSLTPDTAISGTVTDTGGAPQAGTKVTASGPDSWGEAYTGVDGTYTITGLQPGDHTVQFDPEGNLVAEYYDGARYEADATPVAVVAQSTTTGIDASLETGGTITGTVTDALGDPVAVEVTAYGDQTGLNHSATASGTYILEGLPDDDYRIELRPTDDPYLVTELYDDVLYYWDAELVPAASGQVTSGIDAELATGGRVSGTVTDAGGEPYVDAYVTATNVAEPIVAISAFTGADGSYTIDGLPAGDYLVLLEPPGDHPHVVAEYYDDAPYVGDATPVAVTAGADTPGIDASLAAGGAMSGVVTDSEASPVEGATVTATSAGGEWSTSTDAEGAYLLEGLQAGGYTISFTGPDGSGLQTQYWEGVASPDDATPVTIAVGATTDGIDATLVPEPTGGSISGTVTDEGTGLPVEGVDVTVWSADEGEYFDTITGADGSYQVVGLPDSETYWVAFLPDFDSGYLYEYYDGAPSLFDATYVVVEGGAAVTDIDASLQKAGTISGNVTDEATGLPLADVLVTAETGCFCAFFGITDENGDYVIEDVEPGTYTVSFEALDPDLAVEYYDNVFRAELATPVEVASGEDVTDVDAALRSTKSKLTGVVTDAITGDPLAGVTVTIYDAATDNVVRSTTTAPDGTYLLNKFRAGEYKVRFNGEPTHGIWWAGGGGQTRSAATPVALDPGANFLSATLRPYTELTGTVTDVVSGDPIDGVVVTLYHAIADTVVTSVLTGPDGTYLVDRIPAGSYKVRFYGEPTHGFWWAGGGGQSRSTAAPVVLSPDPNTLDASLQPHP